jgi:signal peptidase I
VFGIFASQDRKMRSTAEHWIELAERVWHYRRDLLNQVETQRLLGHTQELREAVRVKQDAAKLKLLIERLEETLREVGGRVYPKSSLVENVEFFLMAAIVILGIKVYFIQPFKIPTNSMWPSYYGMTPEVYPQGEPTPALPKQAARFVLFGAVHHELVAPESGNIRVPVRYNEFGGSDGRVAYDTVDGRKWLVLPTKLRQYLFYVNETPLKLLLPLDFDFDVAFREAFGVTADQMIGEARNSKRGGSGIRWVELPVKAEAGKPFLSFDVMTGDQLFVDRVSYHFFRPEVGQGFVFRTGNIPRIAAEYGDQYYIKRLVGRPGDVLEVKEPVLWRNGAPITGAKAFELNARREGKYHGYGYAPEVYALLLQRGTTATVPEGKFLALGDNSANSSDGRYWGYVPAKDVVGKPLFIYFPFTSRWLRSP